MYFSATAGRVASLRSRLIQIYTMIPFQWDEAVRQASLLSPGISLADFNIAIQLLHSLAWVSSVAW